MLLTKLTWRLSRARCVLTWLSYLSHFWISYNLFWNCLSYDVMCTPSVLLTTLTWRLSRVKCFSNVPDEIHFCVDIFCTYETAWVMVSTPNMCSRYVFSETHSSSYDVFIFNFEDYTSAVKCIIITSIRSKLISASCVCFCDRAFYSATIFTWLDDLMKDIGRFQAQEDDFTQRSAYNPSGHEGFEGFLYAKPSWRGSKYDSSLELRGRGVERFLRKSLILVCVCRKLPASERNSVECWLVCMKFEDTCYVAAGVWWRPIFSEGYDLNISTPAFYDWIQLVLKHFPANHWLGFSIEEIANNVRFSQ